MKLKHVEYYRQQIQMGNLQSGPGRISVRQKGSSGIHGGGAAPLAYGGTSHLASGSNGTMRAPPGASGSSDPPNLITSANLAMSGASKAQGQRLGDLQQHDEDDGGNDDDSRRQANQAYGDADSRLQQHHRYGDEEDTENAGKQMSSS